MWVLLLIILVTILYLKARKRHSYWTDRGVKQSKGLPLLGDSASILFRTETAWDAMMRLYKAFPSERYMGFYQFMQPILLIRDPDLIKQMTVKDFDHFVDHRRFIADEADPLWSRNLFALQGNRWRDMRSVLSPTFTSSKMKTIFLLISECAEEFTGHFLEEEEETITVELKDTVTKYTNDVIGSVAFGFKCNSMKEPNNEFYSMGKEVTSIFTGFKNTMKFIAFTTVPQLCKMLGMSFFGKQTRNFFTSIVEENIRMREKHEIVRQDMLHLLLEARKGRLKHDDNPNLVDTGFATVEESHADRRTVAKEDITNLDITAQALIFFFAGFDTVSTLMCFMGHELAVNESIQRKLQEEIEETSQNCDGTLSYEALMKMKYMDMVVCETLRKWAPSFGTDRVCVKPYTIQPVKSSEKPVLINVGDMIWIPISNLHWDPQYYTDPEVFDPERFCDANKHNINPYTYLPFGVGPRNCIGSRFALLEVKTLFFHLLSKFDLVVVKETQIPLRLKKASFNMSVEKGFWIGLRRRSVTK